MFYEIRMKEKEVLSKLSYLISLEFEINTNQIAQNGLDKKRAKVKLRMSSKSIK